MSAAPDGCRIDVLVAGAGPAGAVAARELARAGCSVLLADRLRPSAPRLGETLPGAAIRLLRRLDLESVARSGGDSGHCRVGGMLVAWQSDAVVASDAIADPYGAGIRLDRARFDADLRAASVDAGVSLRRADVTAVTRTTLGWSVGFDDGPDVSATWLIDATGRRGRLVRLIGVRASRPRGLVAVYRHGRPQRNAALDRTVIEARPEGWFYAGRLGDGRWAFGLHTTPAQAAALRRDPARWATLVGDAPQLSALFGETAFEGYPVFRDARDGRLDPPAGERWVACGDAALGVDPIAGQGLFNALRSGMGAAGHVLSGGGEPDYAAELAEVARTYRDRRDALYAAQPRWRDAPFWRARRDELA